MDPLYTREGRNEMRWVVPVVLCAIIFWAVYALFNYNHSGFILFEDQHQTYAELARVTVWYDHDLEELNNYVRNQPNIASDQQCQDEANRLRDNVVKHVSVYEHITANLDIAKLNKVANKRHWATVPLPEKLEMPPQVLALKAHLVQ